ncbi:hypothetical protein ABMA27_012312 [Loxostege sticticalis]|uniref:Uncharacterized protein n=1 Tax=Loxostege sticticalis TaxID=481309 RepID=A0ABR3H1M6_LOXSC
MEPGEQKFKAILPKTRGQLISFVCVNLEGTPKENAVVDFKSLFHVVKVHLKEPVDHEVRIRILAKQHGY